MFRSGGTTTAMLLAEAGCVFMAFILCISGMNNCLSLLINDRKYDIYNMGLLTVICRKDNVLLDYRS